MSRPVWITAAILLLAAPLQAQKLPEKIGYTIFIRGEAVGRCDIEVSHTDEGDVVFESKTTVDKEPFHLERTCRTVSNADATAFKLVEYDGVITGKQSRGDVQIDGKDVLFNFGIEREDMRAVKEAPATPVLVLENYVVEHEIIIARAHAALGEPLHTYAMVLPSSGAVQRTTIETRSRMAVESAIREAVCDKFVISIQGSQPFASMYDPKSGMPVYLAFPTVETEFFLDSFHGDEPQSRWVKQD